MHSDREKLVKHMVDRFLRWRLPEDFNPDGGISFKPVFNEHTAHPMKAEPVGTNLFDAQQAEAMVRYMLDGAPALSEPVKDEPVAWPKIMYVCEYCQEHNPEMCGHDRADLYVTPDGKWLCDGCLDEEGIAHADCVSPPKLYTTPPASAAQAAPGAMTALTAEPQAVPCAPTGETFAVEHDGFIGTVQGGYVTREGKRGIVLQQLGTRVVHVYGEKWLTPASSPRKEGSGDA